MWSELERLPPEAQGPTLREWAEASWPYDFADPEFGRAHVPSILREGAFLNASAMPMAGEAYALLVGDEAEDRLRSIQCPVLVIHGTADPRPVDSAQRLASSLPDGRFVPLEGVGHHAALEAPSALRDAVRIFLSTLPPVNAPSDPEPS